MLNHLTLKYFVYNVTIGSSVFPICGCVEASVIGCLCIPVSSDFISDTAPPKQQQAV